VHNILYPTLLFKNIKIKIYTNIIFLVIFLYVRETWSLTLRKERRLRLFENWVQRRIFWPKIDEVTGEWRRLHIEELNDLYCSPIIVRVIKSRRIRWAEHVTRMGDRYVRGFWWESLKKIDHVQDLSIDGRTILT
jgi:hypothetical protein